MSSDGDSNHLVAATVPQPPAWGGALVLTSVHVAPGDATLGLAEALARDSNSEVWVLAPAGPALEAGAPVRRTDSICGQVRIIRVPVAPEGDPRSADRVGPDPRDWRRRGGAWRDRRVALKAPLRVRVAHVAYAKRVRARSQERPSVVDPALIAMTRLPTLVFRVLARVDASAERVGRRVSDLHDRVDLVRGRQPGWTDLFPESPALAAAYAPLLDRIEWDSLHIADPHVVGVARDAVARRQNGGGSARWVRHLPASGSPAEEDRERALRERAAAHRLLTGIAAEDGQALPTPATSPGVEAPTERPWSRGDLPAVVGFGAETTDGQQRARAAALEGCAPGVRTEVMAEQPGAALAGDQSQRESLEAQVLDTWTHAVIDGSRGLFGDGDAAALAGDLGALRDAGIVAGLILHGSDVRDPRLHSTRTPWSPYTDDADADDHVRSQQSRRDALTRELAGFEGPSWVSSPDLVEDLPGAEWLPVVVEMAQWSAGVVPMRRERPIVVHAPTSPRLEGTALIEEALGELHRERLIDYRRVEGVPWTRMPPVLGTADIVVDQVALGTYGLSAVQAMASGRVVLGHVMDSVRERCPGLPVVEATPVSIDRVIRELLDDRAQAQRIATQGRLYAARVHNGDVSGALLAQGLRPHAAGTSSGRLRAHPATAPSARASV